MRSNQAVIDKLAWKKFPLLNDGFVCLVDVMGDDQAVVQAARVSYGEGTKHTSDDRTLIRYLMRHRHTTPLEMCEIKFLIRCPMDCWRQWIRHRTASVNEYSTRYSEAIDSRQKTTEWRLQSDTNKQGSKQGQLLWPEGYQVTEKGDGFEITHPDRDPFFCHSPDPADYLKERENAAHGMSQSIYEERLRFGIAREQARKDLPLSTYTEAYWKIDLHNLLHFLGLRMDSHAQQEIREYATVLGEGIVKPLFPLVWEAFEEYRLEAMQLNYLDKEMIRHFMTLATREGSTRLDKFNEIIDGFSVFKDWRSEKCRERDECRNKLRELNIL